MVKWVRQLFERHRGDSMAVESASATASAADLVHGGNALLDRGDFTAASSRFRDAIAIEPSHAEAHCRLGICLKACGDPRQAEQHLARALSLDSTLIDAHFALGDLALANSMPDVAETHWRTALGLAPDFEIAYLALCQLLVARGEFNAAQQLICAGLAHLPASADLHFYLGNLQFRQQQYAAAENSYRTALDQQPQRAEILANLGLAQLQLEQTDAAIASLHAATAIDPGMAGTWNNLGNAYLKLNQADNAADAFRHVAALEPRNADAHFNLGNVLYHQDRIDEAVDHFRAAAALAPDRREVHANLGSALLRQGNGVEAIASLRQALAAAPSSVEAHYNLATALQSLGRRDEAVDAYQAALASDPAHVASLFNLGTLLESEGDLAKALEWYGKVTTLEPGHAATHCNMGCIFKAQHDFEKALACFQAALNADSRLTAARINMVDVFVLQSRYADVIASCNDVLELEPAHAGVRTIRSLALLASGNYSAGWKEYEYRWHCADSAAKPVFEESEWDGLQSLEGKTILLYAEQGLGDTLQFIRYAPLVAERGAIVHVAAPQQLQTLIARCEGVSAVFAPGELPARFDYHCPLMSLPLLLGTTLSSIPAKVPYLTCSPEKKSQWQEHLGRKTALRVGLVWAGNPRKDHPSDSIDRMRSLRFDQIASLLEIEDVEFFSLQVGGEAAAQLNGDPRVVDLTAKLRDFEDTAALVSNLDLVISVDTSVVHLTGAIGKPVWVLNRYNSCWRWLTERNDSPWYPTLRLFRQPGFGDWVSVIAEAKKALAELAASTQIAQLARPARHN